MSEHINPGDMVEGKKTHIVTRKIEFKKRSLQRHEITQKLMVAYVLDYNCTVEVIETMSLSAEETEIRSGLPIFGDVGDTLRAESIRLYVAGMRDLLSTTVKEGVSHRHGASVAKCPYHSIAAIQTPWQGHKLCLNMSNNIYQPKQLNK